MSSSDWDPNTRSAPETPAGGPRAADSGAGIPSQEEPATRVGAGESGQEGSGGEASAFFPPEAGEASDSLSEAAVDPVVHERDEYRASLQLLQADFENYKKRVAKQTEEIRERAAESLVEKLLPVLDTADLALSHGGSEDIKQIAASLLAALEKEGLEKIDNAGSPFDPTLHDAVVHEPGEGDGGQEVAEVLRAGYRWRGRVVRAAMVKVRG